jgi:hypothetical protein
MNNESTSLYLVGKRDHQGTFWCWGEFKDEDRARTSYSTACNDYPDLHIDLIKQTTLNEVVETYLPLDCLN